MTSIESEHSLSLEALSECKAISLDLKNKPLKIAHAIINFGNITSLAYLQTFEVIDPASIIMDAGKVLGKYNMVNVVQTKANNLIKRVEGIRNKFADLFLTELPSFWNDQKRIIPSKEYQILFNVRRDDDVKFVQMDKSLGGQTVVEMLGEDFKILDSFQMIIEKLPTMSHSLFFELQVLIR